MEQGGPRASKRAVDVRPLLAFAALAVVDLAVLAARDAGGGRGGRLLVFVFALTYPVAVGALSTLALFAGQGSRLRGGLLVVAAAAAGALLGEEDFMNAAGRAGLGRWASLGLGAAAAIGIVAVGLGVGRLVRSPRVPTRVRALVRGGLVAAAVLVHLASHLLFPRSYPALHLAALALAATIGAAALPPWRPGRRGIVVGALVVASAGLAAPVPMRALVPLLKRPGLALVPFVARAHAAFHRATKRRGAPAERPARHPTTPGVRIEKPIVVLVTIDAMRADVLDRAPGSLPTLSRLATTGVRFTDARSPAPSTMVSLTAIFTDRFYTETRWAHHPKAQRLFPAADPSPRLAEILGDAGVGSVAVGGPMWMDPELGITRGFREVREAPLTRGGVYVDADSSLEALADALVAHRDAPTFAFAHLLEPHAPYDTAGTEGSTWDRYVREIAICDRALGAFIARLEREGLWDRTVLLVGADHGEAFGEHDTEFHGLTLYEEMVRVPLLVRAPGVAPRSVSDPVSMMDVAPTVLDLYGIDTPGAFEGASLVPVLMGGELAPRPIVLQSGRLMEAMVFPDRFKVIHDRRTGAAELYDLSTDPGETKDQLPELGETRPQLDELLEFFEARDLEGYDPPFTPL